MSSFFTKKLFGIGLKLISGGTIITGIGTVTVAGIGCYNINSIRPRTYTDDYHLTPEVLRMPYRDIEFGTEDGVTLRGWWIESTVDGKESDKIAILMHPYNNHKSNLLGIANGLFDRGYNVFMFDFRSFSKDIQRQSIGYLEKFDAISAIEWVLRNKTNYYNINNNPTSNDEFNKQIVTMGASMGGSCAILATYHFNSNAQLNSMVEPISCIVTDCSFSNLNDTIRHRIKIRFPYFPAFMFGPTMFIMNLFNQFIFGYDIDQVSPLNVVKNDNFDTPILFLHSELDTVVPVEQAKSMYNNCHSKIKELKIFKAAEHCGGFYIIGQRKFMKTVISWVDNIFENQNNIVYDDRIIDHGLQSQNILSNTSNMNIDKGYHSIKN